MMENSPVLIIFDGLDEIGSDDLRDRVIEVIIESVYVLETHMRVDLRVVITTRPPAIAGRREQLADFSRFTVSPLSEEKIQSYVKRWLSTQSLEQDEKKRINESFAKLQKEPHVKALAKNPMQLAVLLHFISLKGEAVPRHRSELYRQYFEIVIDRDVAKFPDLIERRETVEALHKFLGYKIHALTEAKLSDGTLSRSTLLELVEEWLRSQENDLETADQLFKIGEERLGLIVVLRGIGENSMYGYEIQPIREYFAAAYINDQIIGDAHDVFHKIARRSYWKEVAAFLAGLRRSNEKADLLSRARSLDNHAEFGWRQDGRTLVLQLLQEGIFSQPRHVFLRAIDFLIDSLDDEIIQVQNEPKGIVELLPALIRQDNAKEHFNRIMSLLHRHRYSSDEYAIFRIYKVASQLLDKNQIIEELMNYKTDDYELLTKVRLIWPYSWGIDISSVAVNSNYWEDIPDTAWAKSWYYAALQSDKATILPAPQYFHQLLFNEFASNPSRITDLRSDIHVLSSQSNWAIWCLIKYHQISILLLSPSSRGAKKDLIASSLEKDANLDYTGLNPLEASLVKDFITIYRQMLRTYIHDKDKTIEVFSDNIAVVSKYLSEGGIVAWAAFRCTINFLNIVWLSEAEIERSASSRNRLKIGDFFEKHDQFSVIRDEILAYFPEYIQYLENFDFRYYYHLRTIIDLIPTHIRLERDGRVYRFVDVLADVIHDDKKSNLTWVKSITLTTMVLSELVKLFPDNLAMLLAKLNEFDFVHVGVGKSLSTPHVQKIVKIVRATEDRRILHGALLALSTSKFLKIAGSSMIAKMSQGSFSHNTIITRLFERFQIELGQLSKDEIEIIKELANHIIDQPNLYSYRLVLGAASYLAEHLPIALPPLLEEEERLKIYVGTQ